MNAPTKIAAPLTMVGAHMFRSELLERCAQFEHLLMDVAKKAKVKLSPKAPTNQRIHALLSAIETKQSLDKFDKRVSAILEKADALMALRNELAHGTMRILTIDGEDCILVSNAIRAQELLCLCAIVRRSEFDVALRQFAQLNNQLKQALNPPSPPPPAPDAATGP